VSCTFTFLLWGKAALSKPDYPLRGLLILFGGLTPLASAVVISFINEGNHGVLVLLSTVVKLASPSVFLAAILIPLIIVSIGGGLHELLRPNAAAISKYNKELAQGRPSVYPNLPGPVLYCLFMLASPLLIFEEVGWRGFVLPRLIAMGFSPTIASLILGAAWAIWHTPLFLPGPDPKAPAHPLAAESLYLFPRRLATYVLLLSLISVPLTWVHLRADGCLWPAILFHASFNSSFSLFKLERVGSYFESVVLVLVSVGVFGSFM